MERRRAETTQRLTVCLGDREVFSRDVESFTCEEDISGKFTAEASFTPVTVDWPSDG